jgi:Fur family iron response transcriptional regulator
LSPGRARFIAWGGYANHIEIMDRERPYSKAIARLREAGLRPTRQRLALAKLLFEDGDRHVSAELLHGEARRAGVRVSLATVYNTLHQFTTAGLMNEVVVDPTRSYFDTNTTDHHHFYFVESGRLEDIAEDRIGPMELPDPPAGTTIKRVDVVIRLDGGS